MIAGLPDSSSSRTCGVDGRTPTEVNMPASWRKLLILFGFAAVVLLPAGGAAAVHAGGVHEAVWAYRSAHPGQPVPVIVQAAPSADSAALVRDAGGEVRGDLGMIHAVAADVPAARLEALAAAPGVTWISLDGPVTSTSKPGGDEGDDASDAAGPPSVYPQEIQADDAWAAGNRGQGVAVAVVDTGIVKSADFGAPGVIVEMSPKGERGGDGYGHGSHVAGLIAGDGTHSHGLYTGVAPGADLVNVKVGDETGAATISDVIDGLQFVFLNKDRFNIRVVNLSLSVDTPQSYTTDPLDAAVELLTFRGMLVVAAAGNAGTAAGAVSYAPANDPFVLTIGAVDDLGTGDIGDDSVPSWSSRGVTQDGFAKPELSTPGRHLISVLSPGSVLASQAPEDIVGKHYFRLSGTSMAAGVASGAAALVFNAHPDWTPGQVKTALIAGAAPLPSDTSARIAQVDAANGQVSPDDPTPAIKPNYLLLSAAGFADPASIRWGSIRWGSIRWGSIRWGSVRWGSVRWGTVRWGYVPD
jgi:serine protease AprX